MPADYGTILQTYGTIAGAIYAIKAIVLPAMFEKNSRGEKYLPKSSLAWFVLPFPVDYIVSASMSQNLESKLKN